MWTKDEGYHSQQFCHLSKILEKEGFEQDSAKLDLVGKGCVCAVENVSNSREIEKLIQSLEKDISFGKR